MAAGAFRSAAPLGAFQDHALAALDGSDSGQGHGQLLAEGRQATLCARFCRKHQFIIFAPFKGKVQGAGGLGRVERPGLGRVEFRRCAGIDGRLVFPNHHGHARRFGQSAGVGQEAVGDVDHGASDAAGGQRPSQGHAVGGRSKPTFGRRLGLAACRPSGDGGRGPAQFARDPEIVSRLGAASAHQVARRAAQRHHVDHGRPGRPAHVSPGDGRRHPVRRPAHPPLELFGQTRVRRHGQRDQKRHGLGAHGRHVAQRRRGGPEPHLSGGDPLESEVHALDRQVGGGHQPVPQHGGVVPRTQQHVRAVRPADGRQPGHQRRLVHEPYRASPGRPSGAGPGRRRRRGTAGRRVRCPAAPERREPPRSRPTARAKGPGRRPPQRAR